MHLPLAVSHVPDSEQSQSVLHLYTGVDALAPQVPSHALSLKLP